MIIYFLDILFKIVFLNIGVDFFFVCILNLDFVIKQFICLFKFCL